MIELNKIYNEDCYVGLRSIPDNSVDLVLTDPPYELTKHGGGQAAISKRARAKRDELDFIANDFDRDLVFSEFLRVLKAPNLLIFCSNKQLGKTLTWFEDRGLTTTTLVWQKTNPAPLGNMNYMSDVEFIVYVRGKGSTFNTDVPIQMKRKVYTSPICPDGKLHPTQKSVDHLRRYLAIHSNENDVVLDPFMGSGTTAIACIREKRNFIGFELEKKYFEIANKRINAERQQLSLW